ncbi:MAG: hypothetical protein DRH44_07580 [Candidatus Coatesbacteria bacterium]|nr:MAG: hypothetical protein DRH44_07580 [Candidatus Coatesbacteria bacterium]
MTERGEKEMDLRALLGRLNEFLNLVFSGGQPRDHVDSVLRMFCLVHGIRCELGSYGAAESYDTGDWCYERSVKIDGRDHKLIVSGYFDKIIGAEVISCG